MEVDQETGEEIMRDPRDGWTRLETQEQVMAALAWIEEQMAPWYRMRRRLRDFATRRWPPPKMPAQRRYRTEIQEKVARCPRCGGTYKDEGAPTDDAPSEP